MFLSFLLTLDNIFKDSNYGWQVKEVSPGVNKACNMGVPIKPFETIRCRLVTQVVITGFPDCVARGRELVVPWLSNLLKSLNLFWIFQSGSNGASYF